MRADVVLTLNVKIDFTKTRLLISKTRLIEVNRSAQQIGQTLSVEVGIIGYADAVAGQILECIKSKTEKRNSSAWVDTLVGILGKVKEESMPSFLSEHIPVHPARLAAEVQKFLNTEEGKEYNLVLDGGDCMMWEYSAADNYLNDPGSHIGRVYNGSRFGSIGAGAGGTTGMWAATGRPILYSTGDGSVGQYFAEFFTYAKFNIPVVCIISNDHNYGMIRVVAEICTPDGNCDIGSLLECSDGSIFRYEKLAEAYGGYGELVTDPNEIVPALKRANASGKPAIINVDVWSDQCAYNARSKGLYSALFT